MPTRPDRICLGAIAGAHGVAGAVRIKSFTEAPGDIAAYGPLTDETGDRRLSLTVIGEVRGQVIARIEGIDDRAAAAALKGLRLYVERGQLPRPEEGAFYHADLVGLAAFGADGARLGEVSAVHDFGAGDILEVALDGGGTAMVPFTAAAVPEVDIDGGRVVIVPPKGLIGGKGEPGADAPRHRRRRTGKRS